ncbi:hypothetical protein [Chitinophaga japonensis]|uniref:Uncharacterized protein n=1 Tax=Chitinophaga japonensis TaxID=104662 RepID=A0A562TBD3_CHIJA|nr:hypothetical protein [Chitinophaga japonensis]TWI90865.1 hypothetical protein LX66_0225 [Chitinophaga japonensis]
MKRSSPIYTIIFFFLALMLGIAYFRQQQRVRKILVQNERLLNENRDLQQSLRSVSGTAQQIAERKEQQQRQQGKFVERRAYYRRNWQQFIAVSTNDYRTGFLGGIKNLELTVRNQTEYPLDNVVVTVQYLRSNGEVFKTERYTISEVPAKGTRSIEAAASRKGMKVQLKLISITSQAMNFCWAYDKPVPAGAPDPYECVK